MSNTEIKSYVLTDTMSRKFQATSTHLCFCFLLKFAQIFGLLPVSGITNESPHFLRFSWKSKRTIYSLLFLAFATINVIFQILKMIRERSLSFGYTVTLLFFAVTVITIIIFLDVARKWPNLIQKWSEVEADLSESYAFPPNLHFKLIIVAIIIITAAIVEHSLLLALVINYRKTGENFMDTVRLYFVNYFSHFFAVVPYNVIFGILNQLVNSFSTVSWNFMDLFIMLISLALSSRFQQVVDRVRSLAKDKIRNERIWRRVREDYTKLVVLSRIVDDTISTIMLVSFANNVFVVLVQLYSVLERPPSVGMLDKTYYVYSFSFLIIRTVCVVLFAATVHSESKKPQFYLNSVMDDVYSIEIERFLYQVKYDTVALTGHKLFKVTKSLILNIAGAIVSYELILIEFNVS